MTKFDLDLVLKAIPLACAAHTAQNPSGDNPVAGHCALASVFIQRHYGGTIARGLMSNGTTHYWNILPSGAWLDSTRAQFANDVYPTYVLPDCPENVYWFDDTATKYEAFREEVQWQYYRLLHQVSIYKW